MLVPFISYAFFKASFRESNGNVLLSVFNICGKCRISVYIKKLGNLRCGDFHYNSNLLKEGRSPEKHGWMISVIFKDPHPQVLRSLLYSRVFDE